MKTFRGVGVLALVLGLTLGSLAVHAQAPVGATPSKMYTNKQQFRLPFNLDDRERQKLREIQLYVKCGADGWTCRETASPMQKAFAFRAPQDGEYWFSIVTVDKSGRPVPADVTKEPPALVVVVDTQVPEVQVSPAHHGADECLRCTVRDANPDPSTVKLDYQSRDKGWRALEPVPGSPDLYRYPDKGNWTGQLRVSATDRAENTCTREIAWSMPAAPVAPASDTMTSLLPGHGESRSEKVSVPVTGPDLTPPPVRTSVVPAPMPMPVAREPVPMPMAMPAPLPAPVVRDSVPTPVSVAPPVPPGGRELILTSHEQASPVVAGSRDHNYANRQLINSTHVVLDYRIDQIGPSGVSKVEVWMTGDEGKTWQRLCEDPDRRSPVEFDLPREGLYGICILVTNGNSISDPPPTAGTTPDWWIEVDTTRPTAQLQSVHPGTGEDAGALLITWAASDKNLGGEPVDLYYATRREGPWMAIARGVRNDGTYRWMAPRDGSGEYFIRMDVTDRAGNLTRCETPQAVVLDLSHPKAKVLGVSVNSPRPLAMPTGN